MVAVLHVPPASAPITWHSKRTVPKNIKLDRVTVDLDTLTFGEVGPTTMYGDGVAVRFSRRHRHFVITAASVNTRYVTLRVTYHFGR